MKDERLTQLVKEGFLSPAAGVKALGFKSTHIKDIDLGGEIHTLPCGLNGMDRNAYLRAQQGDLVVLGGLPGCGKTAFAMQIATSVARYGRVLVYSLEMSAESLKRRDLAARAKVPVKKLDMLCHKEAVLKALKEQASLNISVVDETGLTVTDIISRTFDEHNSSPLELVVIDYIGLLNVDEGNRYIQLGKAAEKLRNELARVIKVPILLLSQLNSGFEGRYNQYLLTREKAKYYPDYKPLKNLMRPCLDDIAESKHIGRTADTVLFIHRPWVLDKEAPPNQIQVFAGKSRHGDPQDFNLDFTQEQMRFTDVESDNDI